jgi:hypothetical protein
MPPNAFYGRSLGKLVHDRGGINKGLLHQRAFFQLMWPKKWDLDGVHSASLKRIIPAMMPMATIIADVSKP